MSFRRQPPAVSIIAVSAFCAIAILPVALMFVRHTSSAQLFVLDARQMTLLCRSLAVAAGATVAALALGVPAAVILVRSALFLRLPLAALAIAPLFVPPYVMAGAWISLLDSASWLNSAITNVFGPDARLSMFSPGGVAWCLGISFFPIITAILAVGLVNVDRDLEDDARLVTGCWGVFRHAVFPQVRGHLAGAMLLVFLFVIVRYDVPSLLGINTYPVEIFAQFSAFYDTGAAVTIATPLTVVALLVVAVTWKLVRGRQHGFSVAGVNWPLRSKAGLCRKLATTGVLVALLLITVYGPLAHLTAQIRSVEVLGMAVRTGGADAISTITWAASAATIALLIAVPIGTYLSDSGGRRRAILSLLCWLPIAVPGTVVGLGVATLWSDLPLARFSDVIGVRLTLAYIAMFVPFAVLVTAAGRDRSEATLDEAAALDGASWLQRLAHIELPLHWPAFLAAWMLVFVLSTGELNATVLLVPPGRSTLAVTIDNLLHYGANPVATVLCLAEAILCITPLVIAGSVWYFVARKRCAKPD